MQIIIPMSGIGKRFITAGYKNIKPLVEVDQKPMVEYIVNLFPRDAKFLFICNNNHLKKTNLEKVLKKLVPRGRIVGIPAHKKGPVYAVACAFDYIDDDEEVIIQHVDTYKYWDYYDFLRHTRGKKADAAISANRGFHPSMFLGTNYALAQAKDDWMTTLIEKKPLRDVNKEFASDGTYYFRKGSLVKKYFQQLLESGINLNGEFYVTLVLPLLMADELKVSVYEIQHLAGLGTPIDVESYHSWATYFRSIMAKKPRLKLARDSIVLMPLAGKGKRFSDAGYKTPKPLIDIGGSPMVVRAASYLPSTDNNIFVCLKDHLKKYPLEKGIKKDFPKAEIVSLSGVTEGQACTCEIGLKNADSNQGLHIVACDSFIVYDEKEYEKLLKDEKVDAIAWGVNHIPMSMLRPEMYGWIKKDKNNDITGVSVKKPISEKPFEDYIITGTFYFKKVEIFQKALNSLYKKNKRINNEFYVDSCIDELVKLGYKVKLFPVKHFTCWGTPDELKTYEYWQSFFHKDKLHPYSLKKDRLVSKDEVKELDKKYAPKKRKC